MFKISTRARAIALRVLAGAACIQLLCGDGCSAPPHAPQPDGRLSVSVSSPAGTHYPDDKLGYRITVHNAGPVDVESVGIVSHLDFNLLQVSSTCSVTGPAKQAPSWNPCEGMDKIGIGATVTIDVVALVRSAVVAEAPIDVVVSIAGGATEHAYGTATLANRPGAGYHVYTAAGRDAWADIDATAGTLVVRGPQGPALPYTGPDADGTWHLAGGGGWRETTDLLVGTADLGDGTQPFIAARTFIYSTAAFDGRPLTLFERETLADGSVQTRVHGALLRGSTLQVCVDAAALPVEACPAVALHDYQLRAEEAWFQADDLAHGDRMTFRVARAGGTLMLLRAEPKGTGRVFGIGLALAPGPAGATLAGGDSRGRWGTLALAPAGASLLETLQGPAGGPVTLAGALAPVAGLAGLAQGTLGDPASAVWLAQEGPLAVVAGQPGTPVDGLLQLFSH